MGAPKILSALDVRRLYLTRVAPKQVRRGTRRRAGCWAELGIRAPDDLWPRTYSILALPRRVGLGCEEKISFLFCW